MTLRHLLSNQSGFACDDHGEASPGNEVKIYETADWVKAFIDLPMIADPGTAGRYCSAGFITAGLLIERAASTDLPSFALEVLFEPLDMSRIKASATSSARSSFAPRVMLKLGLLRQQRGEWSRRPHRVGCLDAM